MRIGWAESLRKEKWSRYDTTFVKPLGLRVLKPNVRVAHSCSNAKVARYSYLDAGAEETVTRLSDKVALITGGGTGIGRATALAFAREGATVAVAGRRVEKLKEVTGEIEKHGGSAIALECDVTQVAQVERTVEETAKRFGKLNVLVNNAGIVHVSTVESISEEEWDRVMTVNVKGPFLMSRAALKEF